MEQAKINREKVTNFLVNYALYIVLAAMIVFFIIKEPSFLSISNFTKILSQASTRGILALGVAGLIVLSRYRLISRAYFRVNSNCISIPFTVNNLCCKNVS